MEQASRVYPFLSDGGRSVLRYRGLGASFSCWDWTQSFLAADGRWSTYTLRSGAMPYFRGLEDPAVFVFKFHTREKARAAFGLQERFVAGTWSTSSTRRRTSSPARRTASG